MSMTIQSSVKDKILATIKQRRPSEYEYEIRYHPGKANVVTWCPKVRLQGMMRTVVMDEAHASRLRWMIYLVVLADAAESVRDTIGFKYCLASSSGWTKSPVLWAEIRESSLTGPELVLDMTDKVVLIKEKLKAARDRQKSYADILSAPRCTEYFDLWALSIIMVLTSPVK
ncbi:hypothetical protein Tco_0771089 [Tanacetum coccineum]|uniref:Reverse transcriptase domain-containing protein n=1 Tax=Tanacetum coccineum TaxID=301880 RepID=A0ABQ4ZE06_9ASTR